jgi:DNA helicase II / ATP-dependent DNA helicase PcrA
MTIESLLSELNEPQRLAASMQRQHALVLAGAGCGKTKTIIARAAFLISNGTPANRIQILTFTRRSASEIVERVSVHLGAVAEGLKASTFHTWCMSLIRSAPMAFGSKGYSVIDRDDQLLLFKVLRGKKSSSVLPTAKELLDIYSFARNTRQSLDVTLKKKAPEAYDKKDQIAPIMLAYEARKRDRRYLDYDDILDVVATRMSSTPETCAWVGNQYDYILVDEMQDTNPLQWKLIDPLRKHVTIFCVGDDAQSIYGFRGADFRNVHSFSERVENSTTLKLEKNYRSTQEILDVSNWLLAESPLNYDKVLVAARGLGNRPQLHTFANEWEEGRWIAEDILEKRGAGNSWRDHMILSRSAFAARVVESSLLAKEIPYQFIGGTKLMESAHVRDVLSVLRLVANPQDEIGWMRFLTLWHGVGEVTATNVIERILSEDTFEGCISVLVSESKIPETAALVVNIVKELQGAVSSAISSAVKAMEEVLSEKYKNQDWDRRRRDFRLVEKLAEKHTSILAFIEEYLLDPVHHSHVDRLETNDVVTLITVHSAKGTESKVCYVINVSPGAYPSQYALGDEDEVEEERRVLYVALTRAKDDLIVTRHSYNLWAVPGPSIEQPTTETETPLYFFDNLPDEIFDEKIHKRENWIPMSNLPEATQPLAVGIEIG